MSKQCMFGFSRVTATVLAIAGAASASAGLVTLDLLTDIFGSETSFQLVTDPGLVPVVPNETVPASLASSTAYEFTWTLSAGAYEFTIFDSFGDGICCSFGTGSYSLITPTGTIPSPSGGAFDSEETIGFSIEEHDVPLPATGALVGLGVFCLAWTRRKFRRGA